MISLVFATKSVFPFQIPELLFFMQTQLLELAQPAKVGAKIITVIHPRSRSRMALVNAGAFNMGCSTGSPAEHPVHQVNLSAFWVDVNPVTNAAFTRFVEATGYRTEVESAGQAWGAQDGEFKMVSGLCWKS